MLFFEIVVNSVVCSSLKGKMNHLFTNGKLKKTNSTVKSMIYYSSHPTVCPQVLLISFHRNKTWIHSFPSEFKNTFISRSSTFPLTSFRLPLIIFTIDAIEDSAGKKRQGEEEIFPYIINFKSQIIVFV